MLYLWSGQGAAPHVSLLAAPMDGEGVSRPQRAHHADTAL